MCSRSGFPEYKSVFSDVFRQTSKEVLLHLSTPSDYENISSEQLQRVLSEVTMKKSATKKINQISSVAKKSFGVTFCIDSFTLQLKLLIEQINFIENQVKNIEEEILILLDKFNSPITTIPGIGNIIAATILGETGDISRFSNPSKLVPYARIDASVSQSGDYKSSNNQMSKRGSPYLRKALFNAALVASNYDPVFKAFYQKKIAEEKHHLTAVGAVACKLCYTIYAILKNNCAYKVNFENKLE